jgi:hypothetical protein
MPSTSAILAAPAMASKMSCNSSEALAAPASSEDERHVDLVFQILVRSIRINGITDPPQLWPDVSTIEEILDYIVSSRQNGTDSIIGFHWQASQVHDLDEQLDARLLELDERKIRRFEYDYESETVYLDITGESTLHYQVQAGLRDCIKNRNAKLSALGFIDDPEIRRLIRSIKERGTASIESEGKICKQADVSFGQAGALPSLVCEVS